MTYTLSYCSSRAEVWRWYSRSWRAKFWWLHLFVAAVLAYALGNPTSIQSYAIWFLCIFPLVTFAFAAWPQVRFKPQERTLHVGPAGWSTQIGSLSASRPWSGVSSVQPSNDAVEILSTTGNALIVPLRAFEGRTQMQQFAQDAQSWHREHVA
jgi:hypothetical protein